MNERLEIEKVEHAVDWFADKFKKTLIEYLDDVPLEKRLEATRLLKTEFFIDLQPEGATIIIKTTLEHAENFNTKSAQWLNEAREKASEVKE